MIFCFVHITRLFYTHIYFISKSPIVEELNIVLFISVI